MRPTDPAERRRVRVQYVPRGFGLALTISDETSSDESTSGESMSGGPSAEQQAAANRVTIDRAAGDSAADDDAVPADVDLTDIETNDGYLTVVASGVTTLELRRPDGQSSLLIWDESEVAWDSLRAV